MQAVQLVITAALLLYLFVVVQAVELAVLEAVFVLLGLCRLENRRQRVTEVHRADLAPLGGADLRLVSCPVVSHTASYCEVLSVKVDVLPSQTTDLSNTQTCIIGYLYRKKCRIVFLFQEVL